MTDLLGDAFDPERFRRLGHAWVDRLAAHLAEAQSGRMPVLPWRDPEAMLGAWPAEFGPGGGGDPLEFLDRFLREAQHLQHPRFVGHQCSAPLPLASLAGALADLVNNGSAIYEMGPSATAMERSVLRWLAGRIGFDPARADGVLTHGGSAGNLTALLAARQASAPFDVWEEGLADRPPLCIVGSAEAHYSVKRSAQAMGLGSRGVRLVPADERFRMHPRDLEAALDAAASEGLRVMAVVASAGSTATGALDPLEPIGRICRDRGLWLHVDAAHSGAVVVSERLRPLIQGLEDADSVVVDAHKMLLQPALCTAVLFRDGERSYETFSQQASYLFDRSARLEWFNIAHRTLECTKRPLALGLYLTLKVHGEALLAAFVERMWDLARDFADLIERRPGWELAVRPESNIVCFRHLPQGEPDPDGLQSRIRQAIVEEGSFYLVKTRLRDRTWLRTTLVNPGTTLEDLACLLDRAEAWAAALRDGQGAPRWNHGERRPG
ncbi:MAG: aminotransferase class I/II-fold pyridoxal phosphate-dependent enzyme [Acidobacteria bacterium]|nr:aminotransferase class I/II-fold pyridoxal phosphate-dependent enzyme [Acidobacteriota bacterium]